MFNDTLLADEGFTLSFKGHTTAALPVNASAEEARPAYIPPTCFASMLAPTLNRMVPPT